MTLRIGIAGISGRMGRLLAEEAAALASLAGGTSRSGVGPAGVVLSPDLAALAEISDLIIDFTHASTVVPHAAVLAAAGKPWVLGTTGFDAAATEAIAAAAQKIPVIAAPNYCTGVNVAFAIAERLGATLPADAYDAEILEMHHRQKVDAPSGTALGLGRAVAAGRGVKLEDVMVSGRDGHTAPARTVRSALRLYAAGRLSAATRSLSPPDRADFAHPSCAGPPGFHRSARCAQQSGCTTPRPLYHA